MELNEKEIVALVFTSLQWFKGIKKPNDEEFIAFYDLYHEFKRQADNHQDHLDNLAGKSL